VTEGIVLRTVEFSETSLVLALYTRDFGKLNVIAKGGRRLKGPFESSLDLLSRVNLSVIQKKSESLDLLTESKLIWRFRPTRENFAGLHAGYVVSELVNKFTEAGEPNPFLYDLLRYALADFEHGTFVMRSLLRFEWLFLEALGQKPELNFCVECGKDLSETPESRRLSFAPLDGGVVCSECRAGRSPIMFLSIVARSAIEQLAEQTEPLAEEYRQRPWAQFSWERTVQKEIRGLTSAYYNHLYGQKIKTYDLLPAIARFDREIKPESGKAAPPLPSIHSR